MTSRRVLILTGEDPKTSGGVERFVRELTRTLEGLDYIAEVCFRGNSVPSWLGSPKTKIGRYIEGNLLGYFVARNARKRMDANIAAVFSNGDLGWCAPTPVAPGAKRIQMYNGTYRGQAEAIRPFISYRGYLYLKWWCSKCSRKIRRPQEESSSAIRIKDTGRGFPFFWAQRHGCVASPRCGALPPD